MKRITLLSIALLFVGTTLVAQTSTATYSVQFTSNWTQAAHPHPSGNLPTSAHWSKLVGATHNDQVTFFELGQLASLGIEDVAEAGSNTVFFSEINDAITTGTAYSLVDGPGLATAEGQINIGNITTTNEFPLLTLVSMIAPSPDWMVGINNIELYNAVDDTWMPSISITAAPLDAGTDSGVDYTSPNSDTLPKENISDASGVMPFSTESIGTFVITLESVVLGVDDLSLQNSLSIFPNPAQQSITVSNETSEITRVAIYDVLGKEVLSALNNSKEKTLDISKLSSGIYLLQVTDANNNQTVKKMIKL